MTRFSLLDLVNVTQGETPADAIARVGPLAAHAESLGYHRYWVAEHHGMEGIAGAATALVIAEAGRATSAIRIGSGGIMLPNHSPLVIAEQFGTLDALFPGRVDLGLGRAPGSDQRVARAMRRDLMQEAEAFPRNVAELRAHFTGEPDLGIIAVPGRGAQVEMWILGSSLFGAQLAAALGLPYAFASHFAPAEMEHAIDIYRSRFQPSERLAKPRLMLGLNVFAADTDVEAKLLFSSLQQAFVNLRTGRPGKLPAPVENYEATLDPSAKGMLDHALSCSIVGAPETVRSGLDEFVRRTGADEIMVTAQAFDHKARLRSFEILAEAHRELSRAA